jgi:hypothetical protein
VTRTPHLRSIDVCSTYRSHAAPWTPSFRIALFGTFWHSWRRFPTTVHRCKSTADRSRFGCIPVLGAKGHDVPTQQRGVGFPMHRPELPPLAISDAYTEPSRFQRCGKACCVVQAFSLTRTCSSSLWMLPLIRVVRAPALAGALVAPTKMICKNRDPVARRKKNSFVPSAGNRVFRSDSRPPLFGAGLGHPKGRRRPPDQCDQRTASARIVLVLVLVLPIPVLPPVLRPRS